MTDWLPEVIAGTILIVVGGLLKGAYTLLSEIIWGKKINIKEFQDHIEHFEKYKKKIFDNSANKKFLDEQEPKVQLYSILELRKISTRKLSQMTGISHIHIVKLCQNDTQIIYLPEIQQICRTLNVSITDIIKIHPLTQQNNSVEDN